MTRCIGAREVHPVGLGCMVLSHAYGTPPAREDAIRLLNEALDLGYTHLDTATLYGGGANENLVGEALAGRRDDYFLASKCGMAIVDGTRVIDGRPETLRAQIDESLARLGTDRIDLYYLHRWDKKVPLEESVGELSRMVEAGKVLGIGLSEVCAATLRKAHAVHPITAVQNEYSLWSRNVEIGVIDACAALGTSLVAFSPLARGFLAGGVADPEALPKGDIRKNMPRFQGANFERNLDLLRIVQDQAATLGCTPAQLCLQWVLAQAPHIVVIPGTTSSAHLAENFETSVEPLPANVTKALDQAFRPDRIAGPRYPAATQAEIDTEEFASA